MFRIIERRTTINIVTCHQRDWLNFQVGRKPERVSPLSLSHPVFCPPIWRTLTRHLTHTKNLYIYNSPQLLYIIHTNVTLAANAKTRHTAHATRERERKEGKHHWQKKKLDTHGRNISAALTTLYFCTFGANKRKKKLLTKTENCHI